MMTKIENEKKSIEQKLLRNKLSKEIETFIEHIEGDAGLTPRYTATSLRLNTNDDDDQLLNINGI